MDIEGLCKWGPSVLTLRDRKHPSGRPDEHAETLIKPDPTWELEYQHFCTLVTEGDVGNLESSGRIDDLLASLSSESIV